MTRIDHQSLQSEHNCPPQQIEGLSGGWALGTLWFTFLKGLPFCWDYFLDTFKRELKAPKCLINISLSKDPSKHFIFLQNYNCKGVRRQLLPLQTPLSDSSSRLIFCVIGFCVPPASNGRQVMDVSQGTPQPYAMICPFRHGNRKHKLTRPVFVAPI